jgi:hypothetical protein
MAPVESLASAITVATAEPVVRPKPSPPPAPAPIPAAPVEAVAEPAKPMPIHAPTPPPRPFDLGTIPDAAIPVRAMDAPLPPVRLQTVSANGPLYFADTSSVRMFMERRGPFERVKTRGFIPLNDKR